MGHDPGQDRTTCRQPDTRKNTMISSAQQAGSLIRAGKLTSEQFVQERLDRIASREPTVQAWSHLNPEQALHEARIRDNTNITGPLHGIPVAIKDVIDVAGMPTGMGSPIYRDYHPPADAACV